MRSEICQSGLLGRRVLIVEDRYFVADDLRRFFERHGAEVVAVVADIDRARGIAATGKIELAVLDVDLRGRDVFDVADMLESRGTRFIFVTGFPASHLPERYRDRPIVSKPFSEADLLAQLEVTLCPNVRTGSDDLPT